MEFNIEIKYQKGDIIAAILDPPAQTVGWRNSRGTTVVQDGAIGEVIRVSVAFERYVIYWFTHDEVDEYFIFLANKYSDIRLHDRGFR